MSYICEITGKSRLKGNRVSHANNKSIHFQHANLRDRRIYVPEIKAYKTIRVSSAGLRTLDKKGGLARFVLVTPLEKLSSNLRQLRKVLTHKKPAKKAQEKAAQS